MKTKINWREYVKWWFMLSVLITLAFASLLVLPVNAAVVNCSITIVNTPSTNTTSLIAPDSQIYTFNSSTALTTGWSWQKTISDCPSCVVAQSNYTIGELNDALGDYFDDNPFVCPTLSCINQSQLDAGLTATYNYSADIFNLSTYLKDYSIVLNDKENCLRDLQYCAGQQNMSDELVATKDTLTKNTLSTNKLILFILGMLATAIIVLVATGVMQNWLKRKPEHNL